MIRDVVIHVSNEQPLLADLYSIPVATDVTLVCTNLRTMNGKRPVFADHLDSVFIFPLIHIRFVEIPPGADQRAGALPSGAEARPSEGEPEAAPEPELEIDEDFLRRVREV